MSTPSRTVLVAVLLLLVGALSGCAGRPEASSADSSDPFTPSPDVQIVREHLPVRARDGKLLDTWVFRPEGMQAPIVLQISPYWTNSKPPADAGGDAFSKYLIELLVPQGYAVALSSVRGTGYSEGCFDIGGPRETQDSYDVIETLAAQPWSSGHVAMIGKSYDGTTAIGAATLAPPHLRAIVPISGITDHYRYNFYGGIPYSTGAVFNAYYYVIVGMDVPFPVLAPDARPKVDRPGLLLEDLCPESVSVMAAGLFSGVTGDYSAYWRQRNYTAAASDIRAAVFLIQGLEDWNVKPDHVTGFLDALTVEPKVWLHNWTTPRLGGHVYPMRADWNGTLLRFLQDSFRPDLAPADAGRDVEIQDSTATWASFPEWPPRGDARAFYLATENGRPTLSEKPGQERRHRTFHDQYDVPTVESRIRYVSAPLGADLHYVGAPRLALAAASDLPLGKIVATLLDVGPDGSAVAINYGGLNLRHREGVDRPAAVQPGTQYPLTIEMFPQSDVLPAGHRLGVELAGMGGPFAPVSWGSRITIEESPSTVLSLPVPTGVARVSPAPVPAPCFAC